MLSSISASERLAAVVGLGLALLAPIAGSRLLPPAAPGQEMPAAPPKPFNLVDPEAELVIIGNSKAVSDIQPDRLAALLGEPDLEVRVVSIGSATMPIHYLVVKNCVLGNGARPRAIVIYATPVELLTADLTADRRAKLLITHTVADEPVIARKLYGRHDGGFGALRERANTARDQTLNSLSAAVAGVVSGENGRAALDRAFDAVFGANWARRTTLGSRAGVAGGLPSMSVLAENLEETFVRETWEEARAAGVPLYYAISPVRGEVRQREEQRLEGLQPLLDAALSQSDGWFRLPQPPDDDPAWGSDDEHLGPIGAERNTAAFAAELKDLGW